MSFSVCNFQNGNLKGSTKGNFIFQVSKDILLLYLGNTALDWAVKQNNTDVANVLREHGKN